MSEISRRDFGAVICAMTLTPVGLGTAEAATPKPAGRTPARKYPIASDVVTTAERTIAPGPAPSVPVRLQDLAKYDKAGAGKWKFGAPLAHVRRTDLLPVGHDASTAANANNPSRPVLSNG